MSSKGYCGLSMISVAKGPRADCEAEGAGLDLPGPASPGSQYTILPAESAYAHPAPHAHGAFLERILHQRQVPLKGHAGQRPQQPGIGRIAEVRQLECFLA